MFKVPYSPSPVICAVKICCLGDYESGIGGGKRPNCTFLGVTNNLEIAVLEGSDHGSFRFSFRPFLQTLLPPLQHHSYLGEVGAACVPGGTQLSLPPLLVSSAPSCPFAPCGSHVVTWKATPPFLKSRLFNLASMGRCASLSFKQQ